MAYHTSDEDIKRLFECAQKNKVNSYSPYSKFAVSAAILCKDGTIFNGVNIENCSYPCGICAERAAISHAVSCGHKDFVAMMDHVVCGDEVKNGKPAPDLFLAALGKFTGYDIKPEEALVFEDSPLGIKAANVAGMKSVFVPDPHVNIEKSLKENDATPDLTIESLDKFDFDKFEWIKL